MSASCGCVVGALLDATAEELGAVKPVVLTTFQALVAAIISCCSTDGLMVYDARPRTAAIANHAKGAGYEDMSLYPGARGLIAARDASRSWSTI